MNIFYKIAIRSIGKVQLLQVPIILARTITLNTLILAILFSYTSKNCYASEQYEKLWLAINGNQILSKDKKWHSYIYSQFRFINKNYPWQTTLIESAIGYQLPMNKSIWLGYRWAGNNPNNHFSTENRLFQQMIWDIEPENIKQIILRSRLEETQHTNRNQISLRFREKVSFEGKNYLFFTNLFPLLYDEVFFQLNRTNYTSTFFSQNRLFLGFNLYFSKKTRWEIGYINQFVMRTPLNSQNQLNHILSFTYNFS